MGPPTGPAGRTTRIRAAVAADAPALAAIYNHYVTTTVVTFEEAPVTGEEMAGRLGGIAAAALPWFVAEAEGRVAGYTYASPWRSRFGYRFSTETTVYVAPGFERRGIGAALYAALLPALRERGMHSAIGGIALPNPASVALHEKLGFRPVAHFVEVGFKFGRWHDVGYWQRPLRND
ncbi:MAG: arsinothricin resistance N-acetyltransferase ArsN1 family B [Gemmatimonadales bacterium]